jgi:hypothetical protein
LIQPQYASDEGKIEIDTTDDHDLG